MLHPVLPSIRRPALAVLTVVLAACSSGRGSGQGSSPTATAQASSSHAVSALDVCKLATDAIAELVGAPTDTTPGEAAGGGAECKWEGQANSAGIRRELVVSV